MTRAEDRAFFDDWAEFYDAYYAQQAIDDVSFYVVRARNADGPVLEVGCGTGRIYLELLDAGVDATGIDLSPESLRVLREKADERGLEPDVREADVRTFDARREYALAIIPFRAFCHLLTLDDQLGALRRLHAALVPGGSLVFNTFVPNPAVIADFYEEWQTETFEHAGEIYTARTYTTLDDPVEWIAHETRELYGPDGDQLTENEFHLHLATKRELELLAMQSPFVEWSVQGGFDGGPLEAADQEMVWELRA